MKILLNIWSPFILSHLGDFKHNYNLASLSQCFPDMEFVDVSFPPAIFAANIRAVTMRAAARIPNNWLGNRWENFRKRMGLVSWLPSGYVKKIGADVVVSHGSVPWPFSYDGVPRIIYNNLEGEKFYLRGNLLEQLPIEIEAKRWSLKSADLVITFHPGSKIHLEKNIPELAGKVRCIPPYVPSLEAVEEKEVITKQSNTGTLNLVFIGGEARRKGLPVLVKAWNMMSSDLRSHFKFDVVSDFKDGPVHCIPPDIQSISTLPHKGVIDLIRKAHVVIMPTQYDTFGRILTEGMAAGCCVISSDQEPQDWILNFGDCGILLDPDSPGEIAQALEKVVINPHFRKEIALEGRDRFLNVFHHKVVGALLRNAFLEVQKS